MKYLPVSALLLALCLLPRCVLNLTGGTTSSENGIVMGMIVDSSGTPVENARVTLLPHDYNVVRDAPVPDSSIDTSEESGLYRLHATPGKVYNIEIEHAATGTRALMTRITIRDPDTIFEGKTALRKPGVVKVVIPAGTDMVNGYVYLPGTTLTGRLQNNDVLFETAPAGSIPGVRYISRTDTSLSRVLAVNVIVVASAISTVSGYDIWDHSQQLFLNTTVSGAGMSADVSDFPVLVRLTGSNFNFNQAANDGADIRFTKSDRTSPLPFEIETWDKAGASAAIWVKVDTVYGNNNTGHIVMFWGNPTSTSTPSQSNGPAVFDTSEGFQGVWHLGEKTGAIAKDATLNRYDGTPSDTAPPAAAGKIGGAKSFNGQSTLIRMGGTESGKLNFPKNGTYAISVWVYVTALNMRQQMILSKDNHLQYHLQVKDDLWEFADYDDALSAWDIVTAPAIEKSWKYVAGVRAGTVSRLYVDGTCVDSADSLFSTVAAQRDTSYDVTIGRIAQPSAANPYLYHFNGLIDEVRMSNVTRNDNWIRLCYMNQKTPDALVVFR